MLTFASSTGLLLRRPPQPARWICASGAPLRGRGVWDLDDSRSESNSPPPSIRRGRGSRDDARERRARFQGHRPHGEGGRDSSRDQEWNRSSHDVGSRRPRGGGRPDPRIKNRTDGYWQSETHGDGRTDREGRYEGRESRDRGGNEAEKNWRDSSGDWGERSAPATELQRALAAEDLDLLYGVAPVLGALRSGRRKARTLYVQDRKEGSTGAAGPSRKAGHENAMGQIHRLASALEVPVKVVPKGDLNVLAKGRPHQGCVLHATRLEYEDVADVGAAPARPEELADGSVWADAPVWLVLDEVSDPQNLGALVRSAHFLGAAGVLACKRNSSALTPAVSKASAGAVESMSIRGVASMPRFLRRAKDQGWRIIGAAVADDAVTAGSLSLGVPTLVVLGSEGRGLRPMVRAECDVLVRIGGRSADKLEESGVDSLNVSVAGAIVLHRLLGV